VQACLPQEGFLLNRYMAPINQLSLRECQAFSLLALRP